MKRKDILKENVDVLQRRLSGLKDSLNTNTLSSGQERFIAIYQELINDYIGKCFDVLDIKKFEQTLIEME